MESSCPCKRVSCPRHGNCEACREHHETVKGTPPCCDQQTLRNSRKARKAKD